MPRILGVEIPSNKKIEFTLEAAYINVFWE